MFRKYFQDKAILPLLIVNILIGLFSIAYILLNVESSRLGIISQYRPALGISGVFIQGTKIDLFAFAMVAFVIMAASGWVGYRLFQIKRAYAQAFVALCITALVFNLRVAIAVFSLN
jgi:hypothetical protein